MKFITLTLSTLSLWLLVGCANTTEGAKKDIEIDSEIASNKLKEGMNSASETANNMRESAKETGADLSAAAALTPRLKTAITADKELNDSRNMIDVDSDKVAVTLEGQVYSTAMKNRAEDVVKKEMANIGAKQVLRNNLKVIGGK